MKFSGNFTEIISEKFCGAKIRNKPISKTITDMEKISMSHYLTTLSEGRRKKAPTDVSMFKEYKRMVELEGYAKMAAMQQLMLKYGYRSMSNVYAVLRRAEKIAERVNIWEGSL